MNFWGSHAVWFVIFLIFLCCDLCLYWFVCVLWFWRVGLLIDQPTLESSIPSSSLPRENKLLLEVVSTSFSTTVSFVAIAVFGFLSFESVLLRYPLPSPVVPKHPLPSLVVPRLFSLVTEFILL